MKHFLLFWHWPRWRETERFRILEGLVSRQRCDCCLRFRTVFL